MTNPDPQKRLAEQLSILRRRIQAAPSRSHTAKQAAELVKYLESPDCRLNTAQQLAAARETLREFSDGLKYSDPIRHAPDCGNQ
jgi:hypothetical protein